MNFVVALMVIAIASCGPGAAQIKMAKTAEYKAPASTIFELAKTVAEETYKLGEEDPSKHVFLTAPQYYQREGGRQSVGAGDVVLVRAGSVLLMLKVEVADAGLQRVAVTVTPIVSEVVGGSPMPRALEPTDPNMPPWVHGRVDALWLAIYERARQYIEKP